MSADTDTVVPDRTVSASRGTGRHGWDGFSTGLAAIMAAQAVWLGTLMSRGWYYQADFSNLASANHRPLSLSYLTTSQGGHLGLVGAVVLWFLNRLGGLNHPLTIVLRLAGQAVATALLAKLLAVLVGRRKGVLVVLALYAVSPLLVQSVLWLTSSIGFLGSQLLVLLTLTWHVRYTVTLRLRWAIATAAALFGATLVSEQAAVIGLVLPLLSLAFLHEGPLRERLRGLLRSWREWALIGGPVLAFAAYLLGSGKYHNGTLGVSVPNALRAVGGEWANSVGPSVLGGPFAWNSDNGNYFAFTAPAVAVQIAAGVFFLGLVAVCVRRTGWRALAAWAIPLAVSAIGIVVVAVGRYHEFGGLITRRLEYSAHTAVPAAVALCLAWWRTTPAEIRERLSASAADQPAPQSEPAPPVAGVQLPKQGRRRRLAIAVAAAVVGASLGSAITYDMHWSKSPAHRYVSNLEHDLRAAGPNVNVFDTFVDPAVIPGIEPNRHISDLATLMGLQVHFDGATTTPKVVGADGHLATATFVISTRIVPPTQNSFCSNAVTGSTERHEQFASQPRSNEWYVRLDYFQQHPSVIDIWLIDAGGREIAPVQGSSAVLATRLGRLYLRFPAASPIGIRIQGGSAATNVCLTGITLGYPFRPQS
ncbi:MAG TPA: hypothetical protein VGN35_00750 [Jatrophihabitantaceae bacterium]|nr:hypothetical protein [Jatrophihabitantaceae bacterium]